MRTAQARTRQALEEALVAAVDWITSAMRRTGLATVATTYNPTDRGTPDAKPL
ncbi:hypothetical protein [Hymenobacter roseosalivarius]|uniref:hypothetical protein n=1 Tax=Hymenobacter roseosalivarius TaxID=89967 RepID=UPI00135641C0|nr:hypothetical protein [Hymenobacter roseosalivarius]